MNGFPCYTNGCMSHYPHELYELKRRCAGHDGNSMKCFCIVTVKKENLNVRGIVLNSVVGTLDISIRQFMQGETLPGVTAKRTPILVSNTAVDANQYAYIANVCLKICTASRDSN